MACSNEHNMRLLLLLDRQMVSQKLALKRPAVLAYWQANTESCNSQLE